MCASRSTILLIFVLLPGYLLAFSEPKEVFISPGLKISYLFGEQSGIAFGWEISAFGRVSDDVFAGVALDFDSYPGGRKWHFGAEASYRAFGLCLGPTIVREDEISNFGATVTLWANLWPIPYYAVTLAPNTKLKQEAGLFVKIPFQVAGPRPRFN